MMSFEYRLTTSGNAEATITYGTNQATLYVSYLSDALRDLTAAVSALLEGGKASRCFWLAEPGEYRWSLTRRGNTVWIRVVGFREWEQDRPPKDRGRVLFKAHCPLAEFAAAVLRELERLYTSVGPAGYKARWMAHAFPVAEYKQLRNLTIGRT
jgi:hypothetical protein